MKVIQNIDIEKIIINSKGLQKAINDGIVKGANRSSQEIHATTIANIFEDLCESIEQWLAKNDIELRFNKVTPQLIDGRK